MLRAPTAELAAPGLPTAGWAWSADATLEIDPHTAAFGGQERALEGNSLAVFLECVVAQLDQPCGGEGAHQAGELAAQGGALSEHGAAHSAHALAVAFEQQLHRGLHRRERVGGRGNSHRRGSPADDLAHVALDTGHEFWQRA